GLAVAAEQHFLVGDEPGQAHAVDGDAVNGGAAGAVELGFRGIRGCGDAGLGAGRGHKLCSAEGGAGGGVDLAGVVQLDDLHRVKVLGGLGGKVGGEHRAEGKVRG